MSGPSRLERLPKTYLPPLAGTQTPFALVSASLFALLFTELGAFGVRMSGTRGAQESAVLLVVTGIVVFGGFLVSLVLPLRTHRFPEGEFSDARPVLNVLSSQLVASVLLYVGTCLMALLGFVWLVWPDLVATYNLVKDVFIYMMTGVIYFHLIVAYVRYLTFLYRTKMDNTAKIMVAEVALALFTLVMGLYLLNLDVVNLATVRDPTGLIGLHVTVRDIWMAVILIVSYGWHLKFVADH